MTRANEQDLRDAIAEEVENLEPSDRLWQAVYERSVFKLEQKFPWRKSLSGLAVVAAAAVFAITSLGKGPVPLPPVAASGPSTMSAGNGPVTTLPAGNSTLPAGGRNPQDVQPRIVRYHLATYALIDRTVPDDQLGDVLVKSHQDRKVTPGADEETAMREDNGYSNFLEPGTEIRVIKGVDPKDELTVRYDGAWYVVDSFLGPDDVVK